MIGLIYIVLVLLIDPFVSAHLAIPLAVVMAAGWERGKVFFWVFVMGMWMALTALEPWGVASAVLLSLALGILLIREHFDVSNVWFTIVVSVAVHMIWTLVEGGVITIGNVLVMLVAAGLTWIIMTLTGTGGGVYLKR